MLILYTAHDMESETITPSSWYYERIVSYLRYRPSMAESVRKEVRSFDDAITSTSIKHYVPWKRINNQLICIMTTMGTEDGQGMTREQSVEYLKWVLGELGLATSWNAEISEFLDAGGLHQPANSPDTNRYIYDTWVSWAVDLICDWPWNLFEGDSEGDGRGTKLDVPSLEQTTVHLRERLCKAALLLKLAIPGLKISPTIYDSEKGWASRIDKYWATGPPYQSINNSLSDPWFLPIYKGIDFSGGSYPE